MMTIKEKEWMDIVVSIVHVSLRESYIKDPIAL